MRVSPLEVGGEGSLAVAGVARYSAVRFGSRGFFAKGGAGGVGGGCAHGRG